MIFLLSLPKTNFVHTARLQQQDVSKFEFRKIIKKTKFGLHQYLYEMTS
jgi:hypothetical protein